MTATHNPTPTIDRFRASLPPVAALHATLIGRDAVIDGPFGRKPLIYADYVASGRAVEPVERFVMQDVLPWYANSHTEASHCGRVMTRLRAEARAEILRCTRGGPEHACIFSGSGATAGINRLVHLLKAGPGVRVLIGPYEHHSNILPWRESGAEVVEIPEAPGGGPDMAALRAALQEGGSVIGSFSAASNVTGIMTDVRTVTRVLREAGARVVWDYAGGGPYLPIDLSLGMDAVVVSPHKFLGGPGASGVLLVRRDAVRSHLPSQPGGGTVRFVNDRVQDYRDAVELREEAGTPNVVGDIRAGLVFALKSVAGEDHIAARNAVLWAEALERLSGHPGIEMLGNTDIARLPILSFRLRDGQGGYVGHHQVTRMLSDLYGVQARGGCACAGPYVHNLLGIGAAQSDALRARLLAGDETARPGLIRLNLCWAAPRHEVAHILDAICDLADHVEARQALYLRAALAG